MLIDCFINFIKENYINVKTRIPLLGFKKRGNLMNYYNQNSKEVLNSFGVTESEGLSTQKAQVQLEKYGKNILEDKHKTNPFILFLSQFNSFIIYILLFAVTISFLSGEYVDAIVILIILSFNAIFGFIQEYKAEKAIEALKKLTGLNAKVIRNSKIKIIDSNLLVPGDILILEEGNKVPADARIIESASLKVDEAMLTGESVSVMKTNSVIKGTKVLADQKNMLFSGTAIVKGRAKAIIICTGMNSEIGKIAGMITEKKNESTPLQRKLNILGKKIIWITLALCVLVFIAGEFRAGAVSFITMGDWPNFFLSMKEWFLTAVSLAVAAVPEGLPAVVTIALAIGVKRMLKRNALVRKLPSVETLGETTVICTDKTGTLTMNKMSVRKAFTFTKDINLLSIKNNKISLNKEQELMFRTGLICNDAQLKNNNSTEVIGEPTETALITSGLKVGLRPSNIEKKWNRVFEIPFDSLRKMMSVVAQNTTSKSKIMYSKGAPEMILEKCTQIMINGKIKKLSLKEKNIILNQNNSYAKDALRVLAFAYKTVSKKDHSENNLIFLGLQAMMDPPRKEVAESIRKCKLAGIRVMMLTGDNGLTAKAIASEVGIIGNVMQGSDFSALSPKEKLDTIDLISIFSRVEPKHKMEIVKILKKRGEIVAMTGDGVNDAPAVSSADLGIAMGITGTDVTKEASDLILEDDNFTTIVNAVEEGRGIYQNIKKFVNYLLSSNLAEVLIIFIAILIGMPLPMTAIMILWLNLVTDGLPAVALSLDSIPKNVMNMPPKKKTEAIMDKGMLFNVVLVAILITAAVLGVMSWTANAYPNINPEMQLIKIQTIVFTLLMLMELVRLQVIRSEYKLGMFSNKILVLAILSSFILQLVVIYTPLNKFFGTTFLNVTDWIVMLIATTVVWLIWKAITITPFIRKNYSDV